MSLTVFPGLSHDAQVANTLVMWMIFETERHNNMSLKELHEKIIIPIFGEEVLQELKDYFPPQNVAS